MSVEEGVFTGVAKTEPRPVLFYRKLSL